MSNELKSVQMGKKNSRADTHTHNSKFKMFYQMSHAQLNWKHSTAKDS